MAMVVRSNRHSDGIGGHISTYASAATLYEVGFNHFFRGKKDNEGDIIYFQGHASPGVYARACLEGDLGRALTTFRASGARRAACRRTASLVDAEFGSSRRSRWGWPVISIYQARFQRLPGGRGLKKPTKQRVGFLGEVRPMSRKRSAPSACGGKARDLICSTATFSASTDQCVATVDHPALERSPRGRLNVIKVSGRDWDPLLAKDQTVCSRADG